MIGWLLLFIFVAVNLLLFSAFEKRLHTAGVIDSIIIGLTASLSGSYMVYALIQGLTFETLMLLAPLVMVETVFLVSLRIENLLERTGSHAV